MCSGPEHLACLIAGPVIVSHQEAVACCTFRTRPKLNKCVSFYPDQVRTACVLNVCSSSHTDVPRTTIPPLCKEPEDLEVLPRMPPLRSGRSAFVVSPVWWQSGDSPASGSATCVPCGIRQSLAFLCHILCGRKMITTVHRAHWGHCEGQKTRQTEKCFEVE